MNKEEKLPVGVRKKGKGYEARSKIRGESISVYANSVDEALKKLEAKRIMYGSSQNVDKLTLNDWFEIWFYKVKVCRIKESSVRTSYNVFKRTFGSYIGNRKINDILPLDIQNAINKMSKSGVANHPIRDALSLLRQCLEYAKVNGMIKENPASVVEVPWSFQTHREVVALTMEEQVKFLESKEESWYREMFTFMLLTGVRVGELGGLLWSDIDFNAKKIYIKRSLNCQYNNGRKTAKLTTPKTINSVRTIPFIGEIEEVLLSQKEKQMALRKELGGRYRSKGELKDLVFVTTMGSPCTRYVVEKEIRDYISFAEQEELIEALKEGREPIPIKHFSPHSLRHTFATRCFEKGIEAKVVQEVMGHSSLNITMDIYTHVLKDKLYKEMSKFGTALPKN